MNLALEGCFVALATPFRGGAFDSDAYQAHCESVIAGGVDGLVPCGTTGEAPTLSGEEYVQAIRIAVGAARGKTVIAGAGSYSTAETITTVETARRHGADAALIVTPYYNRPSQDGLVAHFAAIARAVPGFPLVAYNVPFRTGTDLLAPTYVPLAEIREVIGVKEASTSMSRVTEVRQLVGERFSLLAGDDLTMLPFMSVGGRGVISVSANVVPEQVTALIRSALAGDYHRARSLNDALAPLHLALAESNPVPVKAALSLLGRFSDEIRLPLLPATTATRTRVAKALGRLGMATD
jgi:4-hydroxy-tetrahydrodipicolinate synthase